MNRKVPQAIAKARGFAVFLHNCFTNDSKQDEQSHKQGLTKT